MENKIPSYLYHSESFQQHLPEVKRAKFSFLDHTIQNSAKTVKSIYTQAKNAGGENFIRKINPNVKLLSLIYLVVMISIVSNISAQMIAAGFIALLYLIAGLNVLQLYKKIFFLAFIFGFIVVLPASLNVITSGKIIFNLMSFDKPLHFWIYEIPQNIGFTTEGCHVVTLLFFRVLNSISFALLIVFTTPFPSLIKSFKILGVPDTFLMIISLAYKYIFILSKTIEETYFALRSRLISNIKNKNIRELVSGRIFFIFSRSRTNYENTYLAMVSRGYNGKIFLHSQKQLKLKDVIALLIIIAFGIGIIFI
jgi:cobalt/nickel transport system permease protein